MRSKWLWVGVALLIVILMGGTVVYKLTASEEAKLSKLLPHVKAAFLRVKARMESMGHKLYIGRTFVTDAEQAAVDPTKTGTSNSWHEVKRALDVYVYDPDTGKPDMDGKRNDLYRLMHQEAAKEGFTNLAFNPDGSARYITTKSGKKTRDLAHMEMREGLTFAQAHKQAFA